MSEKHETLQPEVRIRLTESQTEMLRRALQGTPEPATDASTLTDTQFIKRQLSGATSEEQKELYI